MKTPTYIIETLNNLDSQISKLEFMRTSLATIYMVQPHDTTAGPAPVPVPVPVPTLVKPDEKAGKKVKKGVRNYKDGSRATAMEGARKILAVVATLTEPFTPAAVQSACGVTEKQAQGSLWRWEARNGWLQRVGKGQYKRTSKFPTTAPVAVATVDGDRAERLRVARVRLAAAESSNERVEAAMQRGLIRELEG